MAGEITQLMTEVANRLQAQDTGRSIKTSSSSAETTAADSTDNDNSMNNSLGKDQFLELLVTQLRYQDPLSPMENKEFISQMAQFSSLEQMNNMNSNLESFLKAETLSQGAALVGKTVETTDPESGETVKSAVEKVGFEDGSVRVYLENGLDVDINSISAVY